MHYWGIIDCIFLHNRVYKGIGVYSSRTVRRFSGVRSLTRKIHTSPTRQCGVSHHAFGDICRQYWYHGPTISKVVYLPAIAPSRCQILGRGSGQYGAKRPEKHCQMAVKRSRKGNCRDVRPPKTPN